jgi:hypothetical protein
VNQIDCYGKVELTGPVSELTLVDTNGLRNHGCLEIWNDLNIRGNVVNTEGSYLEGNFDLVEFDLINQTGAMFCIGTHSVDIDGGHLYNHGNILCVSGGVLSGNFELHNFGKIQMYGGTLAPHRFLINYITGVIKGTGMVHSPQSFENAGFIQSFGGGLILHNMQSDFADETNNNLGFTNTGILSNSPGTTLTIVVLVPDINNQGTIEVNSDGSVVCDCNNLNNEPNAIIRLLGGTLAGKKITQKSGATLQGFGGITGDVIIDNDGLIKLTGPTNIVGDVEIKNDATLQVSDGLTLITGQTTCNGTIYMKGGYLIPQGGLSGNCNVIWEPGLYTNVADFNLDGQVNLKDFAYFADTWLWQTAWR